LLPLFGKDEQTEGIAFFGEIGTVAEEEAAEVIKNGEFTKPMVAYISGVTAQPGVRFSHASAIIERGRGSAQSKIKAFKEAGVEVVDRPEQIATTLKRILRK
jgi:succinyl-CoA synthetase alpha subunit